MNDIFYPHFWSLMIQYIGNDVVLQPSLVIYLPKSHISTYFTNIVFYFLKSYVYIFLKHIKELGIHMRIFIKSFEVWRWNSAHLRLSDLYMKISGGEIWLVIYHNIFIRRYLLYVKWRKRIYLNSWLTSQCT